MNAFGEAAKRTIENAISRVIDDPSALYDKLGELYSFEKRSKAEYLRCVAICKECSPDGRCRICWCPYMLKLASKEWMCPDNRHG